MSAHEYRSIVVKVGTNVLTDREGLLRRPVMRGLVRQLAVLHRAGIKVVLVSSGAVGAGRSLIRPAERLGLVTRRQVLAAVGQVRLIETYARQFAREGITCAQVLATKEDFRDRHHYLNMRGCFAGLLSEGVLPVVNENDVVAVDELMFSDNDELAGLIASMLGVDALIILTDVDGVYDGDPGHPASRLVASMPAEKSQWSRYVRPGRSEFGRGGMMTKCVHAHRLSRLGIATHICNGHVRNVIARLMAGERLGTAFGVARRALNDRKRWMAAGASDAKGGIRIDAGARRAITREDRVASILPVGILAVEGDFERGDLIRIRDADGGDVALGIASYGAERARAAVGKRGERALVHYDQLCVTE